MLKVKPIAINTLRENVLVLSRDCVALRPQRISGSRKVEVRAGGRVLKIGTRATFYEAPTQIALLTIGRAEQKCASLLASVALWVPACAGTSGFWRRQIGST